MLNIKTMQAADPECSKTDFENALLNTAEKDLVLKRSVEKIAMEMKNLELYNSKINHSMEKTRRKWIKIK